MSQTQGSISYGSPPGNGGAGPVFMGARNGDSLDAGGFVVLGQNIGAAGDPSKLLSAREVPLEDFYINFRGNSAIVISDLAAVPFAGNLLTVQTTQGGKVAVQIDAPFEFGNSWLAFTSDDGATSLGGFLAASEQDFRLSLSMQDAVNGTGVVLITAQSYVDAEPTSGNAVIFRVSPHWQPLTGTNEFIVFQDQSVILSLGGSNAYTSFNASPGAGVLQSGDVLTGFLFHGPDAVFAGSVNAFSSNVGNVLISTAATAAGDSPGNLGIWGILSPTARVHIGASDGSAGSGPLKLAAGTLLAVPEDGVIEYDGTNFYKTVGATRSIIV